MNYLKISFGGFFRILILNIFTVISMLFIFLFHNLISSFSKMAMGVSGKIKGGREGCAKGGSGRRHLFLIIDFWHLGKSIFAHPGNQKYVLNQKPFSNHFLAS